MFNGVTTSVPVDQVALMTSLQTHFECALDGRTDRGENIADLLGESIDIMDPIKYHDLWCKTPLCHLPSTFAIHAHALDPYADPVELEREARSALAEALPHIMETYDLLATHPVPASMQGKLLDALLAELGKGAEREMAPVPTLTDLCRPRAMVVSALEEVHIDDEEMAARTAAAGLKKGRVEDEKTLRGNYTHKAERKPKNENKKKRTAVIREAAGKKKRPEQKRKERTVAQPSGLEATPDHAW